MDVRINKGRKQMIMVGPYNGSETGQKTSLKALNLMRIGKSSG
jgi:hypothetical protein